MGDGTFDTGATVTHAYVAAGSYQIRCTAASAANPTISDTERRTVTVTAEAAPAPPVGERPGISVQGLRPRRGVAGVPALFQVFVIPGNLPPSDLVYSWDFGDGGTGTGPSPSHTYATHGVYKVAVVVSSATYPDVEDGGEAEIAVADSTAGVITFTQDTRDAPQPVVTYPAGWNLVSGPAGTVFPQAIGPLYTAAPAGAGYLAVPNTRGIEAGKGYWAYFAGPATVVLAGFTEEETDILVPRGAFVMSGNPVAAFPAGVEGAAAVYAWDAAAGSYVIATTLQPGQGAWIAAADPSSR